MRIFAKAQGSRAELPIVFELLSQHPDAIAVRRQRGLGDAEVALVIELLLAEGSWAQYFVAQPPASRREGGAAEEGEGGGGGGGGATGDGEEEGAGEDWEGGQGWSVESGGVESGGWWSASQRHGVTALHMLVSGGCDESTRGIRR